MRVLSVAFPFPAQLVRGQAYVGGTKLDGSGETIVDFLYTQERTGGLAIFEIKTDKTQLLTVKTIRPDLYGPHRDLSGAVSQVLDQRAELIANFHSRASQMPDSSHVGHVHCFVLAGTTPDPDRRRSFDIYRYSLRDVTVVTFDELVDKLRAIHRCMGQTAAATASQRGGPAQPTLA